MKKLRRLQLISITVACLLIFGSIPSLASDIGASEQTYRIADYYNEDGSFSALGLGLEEIDYARMLTVEEGDTVIAGDRQFLVLAETYSFSFYTQSSLTRVIEWATEYLESLEESGVVIEIEGSVVYPIAAEATAYVIKLNGNKNDLYIIVTEYFSDGSTNEIKVMFKINNNAADVYKIGDYFVYVDTKGNTQIRACYIVK